MNDIEDNRERLRDLALQHIEPASKLEEKIQEQAREKEERKAENKEKEDERKKEEMPEDGDYSDAPSANSYNTPSERKHKRGGRKTNTFGVVNKTSDEFEYIQPTTINKDGDDFDASSVNEDGEVPAQRKHPRGGRKKQRGNRQDLESQKPWSQRNGRLRSPYPEEKEEEPERLQGAEDEKPEVREKAPTPFETGLKHFNMRRAEHSGARPIGISVDRGEKTNGVHTTKKEKRSKKKSKKKSKKSKKEESSSEESSSSSESESESEEEDKKKKKNQKQKQKPFAIRLDLNLEIEIFLRAKIKGQIEITFLE